MTKQANKKPSKKNKKGSTEKIKPGGRYPKPSQVNFKLEEIWNDIYSHLVLVFLNENKNLYQNMDLSALADCINKIHKTFCDQIGDTKSTLRFSILLKKLVPEVAKIYEKIKKNDLTTDTAKDIFKEMFLKLRIFDLQIFYREPKKSDEKLKSKRIWQGDFFFGGKKCNLKQIPDWATWTEEKSNEWAEKFSLDSETISKMDGPFWAAKTMVGKLIDYSPDSIDAFPEQIKQSPFHQNVNEEHFNVWLLCKIFKLHIYEAKKVYDLLAELKSKQIYPYSNGFYRTKVDGTPDYSFPSDEERNQTCMQNLERASFERPWRDLEDFLFSEDEKKDEV